MILNIDRSFEKDTDKIKDKKILSLVADIKDSKGLFFTKLIINFNSL